MRAFIIGYLIMVCQPALALEKYVYQAEWKVYYIDGQDGVLETLHWQGDYKIPKSNCNVRPPLVQKKTNVFERHVVCGKITHILGCSVDESDENDEKKCQIDIENVGSLSVRVNKYMTHKWRMIKEAEFERKQKGTY